MDMTLTVTKRHVREAAEARTALHRGATTGTDCPIARALDEILVPRGYTVYVASMGVVSLKQFDVPVAYAKLPYMAKWLLERFDAREEKWSYSRLPLTFDLEFKSRVDVPLVGSFAFEPRGYPDL